MSSAPCSATEILHPFPPDAALTDVQSPHGRGQRESKLPKQAMHCSFGIHYLFFKHNSEMALWPKMFFFSANSDIM
jgi:hypothetical protein